MKNKKTYKKLIGLILILFVFSINSFSQSKEFKTKDIIKTKSGNIIITPIKHATFVIEANKKIIVVDPVGDRKIFKKFKKPDIILLTDIHGDHYNIKLINQLKKANTVIIGPHAIKKDLPNSKIISNNEKKVFNGFKISAIPMYNTTEGRKERHVKGRGNGYVILINNKRLYISGDTEDIPEMRSLKNIDIAFICMNIPYTMTEEQAASAVLEFKPAIVYPYHYRGKKNGKRIFSDINKFKKIVSKNKNIKVRFLKWY